MELIKKKKKPPVQLRFFFPSSDQTFTVFPTLSSILRILPGWIFPTSTKAFVLLHTMSWLEASSVFLLNKNDQNRDGLAYIGGLLSASQGI